MATIMAQYRKDNHQFLPNNKTLFETVMIADQYGGIVGAANPSGMAVDAFGRARVSQGFTLFDSSHRYSDNGLWDTATVGTASAVFSPNEGVVNLTVDSLADTEVVRETSKVFSYQPGKSLQNLNTFVFSPPKTNLRQRVGYYGTQNGIYLELDGTTVYFVRRSFINGSVINTRISQAEWNLDKLDGAGPSGATLDITKSHIMFIDVEWLGVGSVRCGFIINGSFIHVHSFHHANIITSTYMTTASLPIRYEIKNTGNTSGSSTLKQICSTVLSEGGYELNGTQQTIGIPITSPKSLATAGTYYPVVSIRLKSDRLDSVVIPTAISILGQGNGINYEWRIIADGNVTTTSWTPISATSSVEYTTSGTAISDGRVLASGYLNSSNQASPAINILKESLFKFQLERNGLTSTPKTLSLAIAAGSNSQNVFGSIDWEEVSR
jgi:hypothetical protein